MLLLLVHHMIERKYPF